MLEALGIKLITVLAGFLFETGLATSDKIQIDNAPSWYYETKNPEYIYVFSYKKGGIEKIDPLKNDLEKKMVKKIDKIIETVIYENFKDIKDKAENRLIQEFKNDENLNLFVRSNIKIERIKQRKAKEKGIIQDSQEAAVFGSAVLAKKELINYQKKRVEKLREKIEM
ncbi:MAG: hypothetical protein ACQEQS_10925, partial [Thermodesulfobacteriota bacterium]